MALLHEREAFLVDPKAGEDDVWLVLGGEEVQLRYFGVGHTDGDLVAYLPAQGLLVAGDLFLNGFEPSCDVAAGGNMLEWRRTGASERSSDVPSGGGRG